MAVGVIVGHMYMGYLRPFSVPMSFWGHNECTVLKMTRNSKMAGHRVKWVESWALGVLVLHVCVCF